LPTDFVSLAIGLAMGLLIACIYVMSWKARYTAAIRDDAVHRSLAVTTGKIHEQLLPYLPGFPFNPKDVRFLGSPIDLIIFDGLSEGQVTRIVLAEIKTGCADLTERERSVRDAVRAGEIEWAELRVSRPVPGAVA
jgi:predicted Holliday junction resolvase-like endonuclease